MAALRPERFVGMLLAGALLGAAAIAQGVEPGPNPGPNRSADVSVDAAFSEVDYRSNTVFFRDVVVSQGGMRVAADEARATGLNFDNATWTFNGNVRIAVEGGGLTSSSARVDFRGNRMTLATITGTPAQFEQQRSVDGSMARGRAGSIQYQVDAGVVTLSNEAWLSDGRNEISGQVLVYNIRDQQVRAGPQPGQSDRVRITIRPGESAPAP